MKGSAGAAKNGLDLSEDPRRSHLLADLAKNLIFLLALTLVAAWLIGTYMEVKARSETFRDPGAIPAIDAVIVPGASVYRSGKLSPVLAQRMEAAMTLAMSRPGVKLVVSGHTVPQGYSETKAMREFAVIRGFPAEDLLVDAHGRSTFITLLHCKHKFGLDRVALVTQSYHLPRALYIARRLGLRGYGFDAAPDSEEDWHAREWASRFKDFLLVRVFRYFHAK
jgi:vancomycin permeability regulator SanA